MQITGSIVDWPLIWAVYGGTAVIFTLGGLTAWAVRGAWKLSKRKDL